MDLERLNLNELRQLSQLVKLMGTPTTEDSLQSCINVIDAALSAYRREYAKVREDNQRHG